MMKANGLLLCFVVVAVTALLIDGSALHAEQLFYDDFSDGDAQDGQPVTWRPIDSGYQVNVVGERLEIHDPSGDSGGFTGVVGLTAADTSIRAQCRGLDDHSIPGILARHNPGARYAGYGGGIGPDGTAMIATFGNSFELVEEIPTNLNIVQEDVLLQLDVIGNTIRFWAWPVGQPMPSEPLYQFDDDKVAAGGVSVGTFGWEEGLGSTISCDYVLAATEHIPPNPTVEIVYPPELENVEAPDGGGPSNYTTGFRSHTIFPNEFFTTALPKTHRRLIGFNWRPDGILGQADTATVPDTRIYVSTTSADTPSEEYAANPGSDRLLVFDGQLTVSTSNTGPVGGPKDFDIEFPFQQPFVYDPSSGDNLLVEMEVRGPWHWVGTDEDLGTGKEPINTVWGTDALAESATRAEFSQVPTQFIFAPAPIRLKAGDANQDMSFDQLDLVQVLQAGKYLTDEPATWGEGDWDGAPGGSPGNPPDGNGLFDQLDVVVALGAGTYLTGPYAAVQPNGQLSDSQTSVVYNAGTGEVAVDAPVGGELTSINIDSAAGIFTGDAAANLGGSFDNDSDTNIFKATFGSSFASLSFGNVAQEGLSEEFVVSDLTVVGSLAGGGDLGEVDLVYVPEPASSLLLAIGLVVGLLHFRRFNC